MYHHNSQVDPIYKSGKSSGAVLLLHGFTGTPDCLRPLANHLNSLGFTVSAPLLPGHGTTKENLDKTTWVDWYEGVTKAFSELKEKHSSISVAGLSLGALLALKLAQDYPQSIQSVACLGTPLYLKAWAQFLLPVIVKTPLHRFYQYQKKIGVDVKDPQAKVNYWNIEEMPVSCIYSITQLQRIVRQNLHKVVTPILLVHSRYDSTAPYSSMGDIARQVSSKVTETVTLENCFHLVTLDYEKDIVSQKAGDFFLRFM